MIIACYAFCKSIFHLKYTKKTIIILMLLLVSGIVGIITVLNYVDKITQYTSIRIIDKIIDGKFFQGARMSIYKESIEKILQKPILGWGLCGGWNGIGEYPHNIFLELWQAFGIIFGTVILLLLMLMIMNAIRSKKGNEKSLLIICLALCSQLLISGPVLNDIPFWFLLAILLSKEKQKSVLNWNREQVFNIT